MCSGSASLFSRVPVENLGAHFARAARAAYAAARAAYAAYAADAAARAADAATYAACNTERAWQADRIRQVIPWSTIQAALEAQS